MYTKWTNVAESINIYVFCVRQTRKRQIAISQEAFSVHGCLAQHIKTFGIFSFSYRKYHYSDFRGDILAIKNTRQSPNDILTL